MVEVVVGILDPVPVTDFSRDAWSRHITVSTNFEIDDDGSDGSIPVVLVEPSEPWRDLAIGPAEEPDLSHG